MDHTLLVCKSICRSAFQKEDYIGEDDILALVESGSFVFDNGSGQQTVGPLEAVNFKGGVFYSRHISEKAQMYLFRYRADTDIFGSGKVVFRDTDRIRSTLQLLKLSDSTIQPEVFACKRALFGDLVNQYRLENAPRLGVNSPSDELISAAITHINGNLHSKLNLADLAAQHYLSYIQFSRRFKNATGSTPQDYIIGLRLKKAQALLSETELPIKQIAQFCGFSSEYYFSNFFHKHCSLSPTQYRNLIKTTDADPQD